MAFPTDTADLADFLQTTGPQGESQSRMTSSPLKKGLESPGISKPKSAELPKQNLAGTQTRQKSFQAREARPIPESTRDFADFIKATGPTTPQTVVPLNVSSPRASSFADTPNSPVLASPRPKNTPPRSSNGPKLQARPAAAARGDETSALIDFIREGPPTAGVHRIPRTVAPFRDTLDSDDLETMESEQARSTSLASIPDGSTTSKSYTSLGSRTGLLESSNRKTVQLSPNTKVSTAQAPPDDPQPARKQTRIRDPYAIPSDDEDDLDGLLDSPKPQREEESLMDFLRNAPPPESEAPPKSFMLSNSNASAAKVVPPKSPLRQQFGSHPMGNSNYAVKVGMERNGQAPPSSSGRQTETSALADFLRNTGPPEPPSTPRSTTSVPTKKDNTFSRFFTRRRKIEV